VRVSIQNQILYVHHEDVPQYKPKGSVVRNTYFWALRSIAARSEFNRDWEYEEEVWFALQRMLTAFAESGYLYTRETQLEFSENQVIPPVLRPVSTRRLL
jgi:hypothetical protein